MGGKSKKMSNDDFITEFTRIVSSYLGSLSHKEQDKRIRNATRTIKKRFRLKRVLR